MLFVALLFGFLLVTSALAAPVGGVKAQALAASYYTSYAGSESSTFGSPRAVASVGTRTNTPTSTPTPTSTGPTSTQTNSRTTTNTSTATSTGTPTTIPTPLPTCGPGSDYVIFPSSGATIVPGDALIVGSRCDDCVSAVFLPFTYTLYGASYDIAFASSNGNLQFNSGDPEYSNTCLPNPSFNNVILPHWDDLMTNQTPDQGIYTSVTGIAPNRIFNIEWRACLYAGGVCGGDISFEIRLYEGQERFDLVYGTVAGNGSGATVGVQRGTGSSFTQYSCDTATLNPGLQLTFRPYGCGEPTVTTTPTATITRTTTSTPTTSPTNTVTSTNTSIPTITRTNTPASPTHTFTTTPTPTTTGTPTRTFTPGPEPTNTSTATITFTPTQTGTPTPPGTPSATATFTVTFTNTPTQPSSTPTRTSTVTTTRTSTPTNTPILPTATPTRKPASTRTVDGHVTWEGREGQPDPSQVLPISLTLSLGSTDTDYPTRSTDASGYFTAPVTGLVNGVYAWRVKGPQYLANAGAFALTDAPSTHIEMGLMRVGDANNDNVINSLDFVIMRNSFGRAIGDPGYDERADFDGDQVVNITDFTLMKRNFGMSGAPPISIWEP